MVGNKNNYLQLVNKKTADTIMFVKLYNYSIFSWANFSVNHG